MAAAGNDAESNDGPNASYPCAYDLPNILCVGASDFDDGLTDFSNTGATSVDVFAPGYAIYSTMPTLPGGSPRYDWKSGTSMAAPHVAGLAALLLARDPSLSVDELKTAVMGTAEARPAFAGISVTGGRVDALAAMQSVPRDRDGDGVEDGDDTCPEIRNPEQEPAPCEDRDSDGDTVLDSVDVCRFERNSDSPVGCPGTSEDVDVDGITQAFDNCPTVHNGAQQDTDHDSFGDACDPDDDNDGELDDADNCQFVANPDQANADDDGFGDACDADDDNDGDPDGADNCQTVVNPNQANADKDAFGDACDGDVDGDGRVNGSDNCSTRFNPNQADADRDRLGDACDPTPRGNDVDRDGKPALDDRCPTVYGTLSNGCPPAPKPAPADQDRDGRPDASDACPTEPALTGNGCPLAQVAALSAKAKKRGRKRSARITVTASRVATMRVTVERKKGRRWVRVARRTISGDERDDQAFAPQARLASGAGFDLEQCRGRHLGLQDLPRPLDIRGVSAACRLGVLAFGDSITNGGGELQWGVALQSWALWVARGLGLPYSPHAGDGARMGDVLRTRCPGWGWAV